MISAMAPLCWSMRMRRMPLSKTASSAMAAAAGRSTTPDEMRYRFAANIGTPVAMKTNSPERSRCEETGLALCIGHAIACGPTGTAAERPIRSWSQDAVL